MNRFLSCRRLACWATGLLMVLPAVSASAAPTGIPAATHASLSSLPLSAAFLPAYQQWFDGLAWAAHIDTETVSNLVGGIAPGTVAILVGHAGFSYHTARAGLWTGGKFTLNVLGIESGNPEDRVGDVQGVSNLYARSQFRLYRLTFRQHLGPATLRLGLMSANDYFDVTGQAAQLINSSFGITPTLSGNIPGMATYPYSGLGVMTAVHGGAWEAKAGWYQGDPIHPFSDPFGQGDMALAELDYRNTKQERTYVLKLGAWHYQQRAIYNAVLGPRTSGLYAVAEYAEPLPRGRRLGLFLQAGSTPQSVNLIPYYLGAGFRVKGLLPGRGADVFSMGMTRAWLRNAPYPAETACEITYAAQVVPHIFLQPDLQWVVHPGGLYPNALVAGLSLHVQLF
ncbi:Carbohydrate-selective porin OprB [Acidithiobacillus ferrooxidans ATCC 53993]|uniref:carbohydrate porin n=1 Tax=Acidithiobacillus ferrooxidans TaxID=920 RepID=UPI00017F6E3B|nr:carbohydrate porin [Acidithiobacillus ferrooxidans]ACH82415.1 Carbohydrate-selective porin OprB [Acidithiobacillus ferrooxidans ATCC 53993]